MPELTPQEQQLANQMTDEEWRHINQEYALAQETRLQEQHQHMGYTNLVAWDESVWTDNTVRATSPLSFREISRAIDRAIEMPLPPPPEPGRSQNYPAAPASPTFVRELDDPFGNTPAIQRKRVKSNPLAKLKAAEMILGVAQANVPDVPDAPVRPRYRFFGGSRPATMVMFTTDSADMDESPF